MALKKVILFIILGLMNVDFIHSQQNLSETQRLASLGKIYGFLKYYHPEVAKGKFNWDQEFLEKMPQVMNATNKVSLSKVYLNWINGLGTIKKCRRCDANENHFNKNFDLSWTQDTTLFTNELASKLKYIEKNRNQQKNFYVTNERVGKIKVTNEPTYNDFEFPDEEYRLLGLFKYWNIIEYFYPYKYLTDQPWDEVLLEMIPKYRKTSNKKDYHLTIAELIAKLDDTHARIGLSAKRSKYLPVKISHIENKAVISGFYNDSIAQQNNLKLGDIILKINDVEVQAEVEENLKYVAGSNKNGKIKNTYNRIFNGIEKSVELTIKRNDEIEDLRVNRYDFNDFNYGKDSIDIKSKSINNQVGYINMGTLKFEDVADVFESFENKKSIIIDLRNYPDFIYKYVTRFLNTEKKDFSKLYTPDINYPSRFTFKDNLKTLRSRKAFEGKIILVVNEETVSRAEFTAMAFQTAENVITVGNQTAGADGDVVVFEYLGGYKTSMSGNGISYPNGMETQRKGIRIDIKVTPTINGLRQGRDEVLEKALEIANQ